MKGGHQPAWVALMVARWVRASAYTGYLPYTTVNNTHLHLVRHSHKGDTQYGSEAVLGPRTRPHVNGRVSAAHACTRRWEGFTSETRQRETIQ